MGLEQDQDIEYARLLCEERRLIITYSFINTKKGKLLVIQFRNKSGKVKYSWAPSWESLRIMCQMAIAVEKANNTEMKVLNSEEILKWNKFIDELKHFSKETFTFTDDKLFMKIK